MSGIAATHHEWWVVYVSKTVECQHYYTCGD